MIKKYSEIKKFFEAKFNGNIDPDKWAFITHYIQNYGFKSGKHYEPYVKMLFSNNINLKDVKWDVPFPPNKKSKFTFSDLFAGIGGMRIAFQNIGSKCVFSSEWDKYAQKTYEINFGEMPFGDITKISEKDIPDHDILLAGFPCQAFSIAGRKKGFEDTRGTLFFDIARILKAKKPGAFLLENVKGLYNHCKGKTLRIILETLRDELNYYVPEPEILNAKDFGIPQNRERIYIVGFRQDLQISEFCYPKPKRKKPLIGSIVEEKPVSVKYYMSTQYLKTLREHRARHESKGHGFGFEIRDIDSIANAIVVGGMGRERNLMIDKRIKNYTPVTNIKGEVNREGIRRMTPREWARLQGFPDKFEIKVYDAQAYKQFANAVPIPVIKAIGRKIIQSLTK